VSRFESSVSPQKSKKGTVAIEAKSGYLRLRWRYLGKQYNIYTGLPDEPLSRSVAETKAKTIALDILSGNFDETLAKYKPKKQESKLKELATFEIYQSFLEFKRSQVEASTIKKYESLLEDLKRGLTPENIVQILGVTNNVETVKRKLEWLDQAYRWHDIPNPFANAKQMLKIPPKLSPRPFSSDEVKLIFEGFREKYPHYLPYVQFCVSTGARLQEVNNLKWSQISDDMTRIQILDHKRGKTRAFRLPDLAILALQSVDRSHEYIFTSAEGHQINHGNFRKRYWKDVLDTKKIDYRRPYLCRSTAISHALSKGANPMMVAAVTGHDVQTLYNEYAGFIESSPKMPDLF